MFTRRAGRLRPFKPLARAPGLTEQAFKNKVALRGGETKLALVECFERRAHIVQRPERDIEARIGSGIAQRSRDVPLKSASTKPGRLVTLQALDEGLRTIKRGRFKWCFDRRPPDVRFIRQPDAERGQHACEGMDDDRADIEIVSDKAGMLASGTAKALQGEAFSVPALFQRDLADRAGHVRDRNPQEPVGNLFWRLRGTCLGLNGLCKPLEFFADCRSIKRLVMFRPEDGGKEVRLDAPEQHVRIGDRQRATPPVSRRPRRRASALRADLQTPLFKAQDGPAPCRNGVNVHHGDAQRGAINIGFDNPLESAFINGDIGGCSAHVEPDNLLVAQCFSRPGSAHDASCWPGQDRILAPEDSSVAQPAI